MKDTCIICGEEVPEGRQICFKCEKKPWKDMTPHEIYKLKINQCVNCEYFSRGDNNSYGTCDYILVEGHSRRCSPLLCKVKGIFKPKTGKKRKIELY